MRRPDSGGGWQAIRYSLLKAKEVGPLRRWRAMAAKNACKTCALGMGGQQGGMRNEAGHFPEVCKKSLQALVRPFPITKGCALMYYPEASVLVPRAVDPRSKTPSFKSIVVKVRPATAVSALALPSETGTP